MTTLPPTRMRRPGRLTVAGVIVVGLLVSARADVLLDVPEVFQQHSQWCWAGTSQATLTYFGHTTTQCAIANWAFSRTDCCGSGDFNWSHDCNYWNYMFGGAARGDNPNGSLRGILQDGGVQSTILYTALARTALVTEIDQGRPFIIRFGWTSGGGHFLVGRGYDQGGDYVDYLDPWPGNGYTKALYTWTVGAADHTWTHTLQITTTPPPRLPDLQPHKPDGWPSPLVVSRAAGTHTDGAPFFTGDTLYVDWALLNDGGVATGAGFDVVLTLDGAERARWPVGAALAPGAAHEQSDFLLGPLLAGTHTLRIVVDADNEVVEADETDNSYTRTLTVSTGTPASLSGLVRTADGTPVGGVLVTLGGAGSGTTSTAGTGAYRFEAVGRGAFTVTPSRSEYVFAPATRRAVVRAASKANVNFTATSTRPDLLVKALAAPMGAPRGQTITVAATVVNRGLSLAPPSQLALYWSSDATIEPPDEAAGACAVGALDAGRLFTCRVSVLVPSGLAPGPWRLGARADDGAVIAEASESNNTRSRGVTIR